MSPSTMIRRRSGLYVPRGGLGAGHGGTTPAFVAQTSNATATTSFTKPTGATAGDILVIVCGNTSGAVSITGFQRAYNGLSNPSTVLWRVLDGSEGASFTASISSTYAAALYRGGTGYPAVVALVNPGGDGVSTSTTIAGRSIAPVDGLAIHVMGTSIGSGTRTITPDASVNNRSGYVASFRSGRIVDETVTAGQDLTRSHALSASCSAFCITLFIPKDYYLPAPWVTASSGGNSATASITIPATAAVGDLFVWGCTKTNGTGDGISSTPSGFTTLDSGLAAGTNASRYWWGYKVLQAGDPGSVVSVGFAVGQVWSSVGIVFKNPATSPVDIFGALTSGTSSSGTLASASIASGLGGHIVVAFYAIGDAVVGPNLIPDYTTQPGASELVSLTQNSGNFGITALAVFGATDGHSTIAPTFTVNGTVAWATNVATLKPW